MTVEIRECSVCPVWVERCVHFNGKVIWLTRAARAKEVPEGATRNVYDTEDAALAAFNEAAERLVQGD